MKGRNTLVDNSQAKTNLSNQHNSRQEGWDINFCILGSHEHIIIVDVRNTESNKVDI